MKRRNVSARVWILLGGAVSLGGTLLGCGHNPNHGIDVEQARAAANRVHRPPDPSVRAKMGEDHGG
jgi:hypothetical protein